MNCFFLNLKICHINTSPFQNIIKMKLRHQSLPWIYYFLPAYQPIHQTQFLQTLLLLTQLNLFHHWHPRKTDQFSCKFPKLLFNLTTDETAGWWLCKLTNSGSIFLEASRHQPNHAWKSIIFGNILSNNLYLLLGNRVNRK